MRPSSWIPYGCAGALVIGFAACSPPEATPPAPEAKPATPVRERLPSTPAPRTAVIVEPPVQRPALPRPQPRLPQTPLELETRYFSGLPTPEERGEIIRALGSLATPAAAEVLGRIFQLEKRQELRLDAFEAAFNLPDDTCREQKFAILQRGVSPAMSQIIRLGAIHALADFDDPRVTAALRALTKDRDAEVRKQAVELLKDRAGIPK